MKIKALILSLIVAFLFVGCEEDESTANLSTVGEPAQIIILGDNPYFMGVGNEFVEPGVEVEGGELIKTVVNVSATIPGAYYIEYIAKNPQGVISTAKRDVIAVKNREPFPFGTFSSGTWVGGRPGSGFDGYEITVKEIATGVIYISDILFGYYDQGFGYGPTYAAPGILNHLGGGVYEFQETPTCAFGEVSTTNVTVTGTSMSWNPTLDAYAYNFGDDIFVANFNN